MSLNSLSKALAGLCLALGVFLAAWALRDLQLDWAALRQGDWRALAASLEQAAQAADLQRALLLVALMALLPLSFVVPMSAVCLATGLLLPPAMAIPSILAGLASSTALAYLLARALGVAALGERLQGRLAALDLLRRGARSHGFKAMVLSRYLPLPFALAPVAAAAFGIGFWPVVLGTLLGMLPQTLIYVAVAQAGRAGDLKGLGLALGGLVVLVALTSLLRGRLKRPSTPALLTPQEPPLGPLLTFYSLPDHELSDDARQELWALRPRLGFEVREERLGPDSPLQRQYHDHLPLVFLNGEKLFNFQVDAHVLGQRLRLAAEKREA